MAIVIRVSISPSRVKKSGSKDQYWRTVRDINSALRKIVCLLKPTKEITHDPATGAMKIRTLTTFKNFDMDFTIGKEVTEDLGPVDGRTCQTTVSWDGDNLVCVQRGEKEGRGWTHWLEGNKLHLETETEYGNLQLKHQPVSRKVSKLNQVC
ncbi:hypothetical protein L3Q82_002409 [Scortum barcoo]|uniref:Uncharacterized protein n=1 Tax=Scortum barcoo TaxID=214431 RepID=A0ACB8VY31_9TELE|nr:hypothetical protein L3Q82_002409 [Scortum barcoo]